MIKWDTYKAVLILFMYALDQKDRNIVRIITNNGCSQREIMKSFFITFKIIMSVREELSVNQTKWI